MVLWLGMEKKIYCCDVKNLEIFKNATRIKIENAIGEHTNGKSSNKQVLGLSIWKATNMNFFPSNLEEIFPSLILINIFSSDLSQISSNDLKSFPKLKHLQLNMNLIEFLPEDLFNHNPELEFLNLDNNIIQHIDGKTFSGLNKLRTLLMNNNVCDSLGYAKTRNEVLSIVRRIEENECQSYKYTTTTSTTDNPKTSILSTSDEEIEKLKTEIKNLKNQQKIKEMKNQEILQENQNQIYNFEIQIAQKDEEILNLEEKLKQRNEKIEKLEIKMQENVEKLMKKLDHQLTNCNTDQIMAKVDKQTLDISNLYHKLNLAKKLNDDKKFVDIANIPTFDWCQFVGAEKSKSNPWIKRFMKMFKTQMPSAIFKPCPHFVNSYSCDIYKIENCSSAGGLNIDKCDINDGKLNLYFSIEKPYKKSIHKISLFKKAQGGKKFIEFANIPPFDWCVFVSQKSKVSPWIKRFMKMFRAQLPSGLFRPCPLNGKFEIKNFIVKSEVFMFLPSGMLRYNHHWYSEKNETFMYLSLLVAIDNF
ncbi:hypothetical protein PVAND_016499 [Polypedilum vanderplanki]|uniref:Uncharacterized protein n=1 Tax=Polypedilum vanderplanki TaxID=319348 RepID=A0A9J6BF91_POLVA|nr:hypothetical protein PVAND_016499 [Polypedilum vanderplanki]